MSFIPFPKIPRLNRTVVVTEKIDGTNACVVIEKADPLSLIQPDKCVRVFLEDGSILDIGAQSRNRIITPGGDDNFGFAKWVQENATELAKLGIGHHYGEWWGKGIQREYGLNERRFSLFNTARWGETRPACCHVVPVLKVWNTFEGADSAIRDLRAYGSIAAPGFMNPEGVVAFHSASGQMFKVLIENDDKPKGAL